MFDDDEKPLRAMALRQNGNFHFHILFISSPLFCVLQSYNLTILQCERYDTASNEGSSQIEV